MARAGPGPRPRDPGTLSTFNLLNPPPPPVPRTREREARGSPYGRVPRLGLFFTPFGSRQPPAKRSSRSGPLMKDPKRVGCHPSSSFLSCWLGIHIFVCLPRESFQRKRNLQEQQNSTSEYHHQQQQALTHQCCRRRRQSKGRHLAAGNTTAPPTEIVGRRPESETPRGLWARPFV